MPQIVDENVEKVFGSEWVSKYQNALKTKRNPRLKFENEQEENEFKIFIKQGLNPENPKTKYNKGGIDYDVMLVQTLPEVRVNPIKYGNSVSFKYMGKDWISAIMTDEEVEKLVPNNTYLIAGIYSEKPANNGKVFKNFRIHYFKALAEM